MPEKLITIATYGNIIEANLAKIKLDSQGIECFLADENAVAIYSGAVGEIKLQVRQSDAVEALEILKRIELPPDDYEEPDEND